MRITLKGYITEDGQLKVDLPKDLLAPGAVEVTIETEPDDPLNFQPATLREIRDAGLLGGWEDMQGDTLEWLQLRREERRKGRDWTSS